MKQLSIAIVGIDYQNQRGPARRFDIEICEPGEPVELRPEPKNLYDEHAIAVFSCRGVQLGYLKSERAVWIGTLARQGHSATAIFQGMTAVVGWIRVAFDGDQPTLPPEPQDRQESDDSGFWPDPIYEE